MVIDYLLIGHDRDGEIKRDEYPKNRLLDIKVQVLRTGDGHKGDPLRSFDVHRINHNGALYAVGIARKN